MHQGLLLGRVRQAQQHIFQVVLVGIQRWQGKLGYMQQELRLQAWSWSLRFWQLQGLWMQLLNRSNNFEAADGDGGYCIKLYHSHFFRSLIWGAFGNICPLRISGALAGWKIFRDELL